jgi:Lrp/AsnC family transcriptional regulator for asnA, asnC and gidA
MIDENVIQISAIVKPKTLGLDTCADILMQVEFDKILDVANQIAEYENVTYVACSIGESDVSAQIVAKDTDEIYQFITNVVRKIPGVRKTVTSIVPIVLKDVYQWRVPENVLVDQD